MPLPVSIASELRQMLRTFRAAHGAAAMPTGAGKALEAWVLIKLAETAARTPGWTVSLRRGDGSPLPAGAHFRLPDQRSKIQPSNPSSPCYVLLERRASTWADIDIRLEVHGSVQWKGRSGALHECDVSVLPAEIGESIRQNGGGFPQGLPIVALECKDRTSDGTLDETRQTLARLFDLVLVTRPPSGISCRIFETNAGVHWGVRRPTYVSSFSRGTFGIVRAGGFQVGAHTLSSHYCVARYGSIYDSTLTSVSRLQLDFHNTLNTISAL